MSAEEWRWHPEGFRRLIGGGRRANVEVTPGQGAIKNLVDQETKIRIN